MNRTRSLVGYPRINKPLLRKSAFQRQHPRQSTIYECKDDEAWIQSFGRTDFREQVYVFLVGLIQNMQTSKKTNTNLAFNKIKINLWGEKKSKLQRIIQKHDRLCGLVVRVSGYRYRGPGFDPRRYQISWVVVGLERGPLSILRSIEELLEWKK